MTLLTLSSIWGCSNQTQSRSNKNTLNKQLLKAAESGDIKRTKNLIKDGADVDAKGRYGWTALYIAAKAGKTEVVEELVKAGADVNVKGKYGGTALHWATDNGFIVQLLLDSGANINVTDDDGWTALHEAAYNGYDDNVNKAIEAGKKELIAQLGALEHDHMWGEKSRGKLAALCNKQSKENNHNRGDVLNNPDLQRYIWEFNKNNKPSLRLKKARQYSAEAATKIQAMARGNLVR